jgi:hypothetical protein
VTGIDFADPERGICGSMLASGTVVLFDHDEVIAAGPAAPRLSKGEGETSVELELDGTELSLQVSRIGAPVTLRGEGLGGEELAVCRVFGELRRNGETTELACLGVCSEDDGEEPAGASLTRSIAVAFADGSILALRSARPDGAAEHGDEQVAAEMADAEGTLTEFREPLLSTHYDDSGRQLRATLELWPATEEPLPPVRAAGSVVCGTSLSDGDRRLELAFFRWSMDGKPGLGRYEISSAT